MNPHTGTAVFAIFALVIGVVVFGGTTLAYFLDQRRSDAPKPSSARIRPGRSVTASHRTSAGRTLT